MTRDAPTTLNYFTAPPARRVRFVAWLCSVAIILGGTAPWLFLLRGEFVLERYALLVGGWAGLGVGVVGCFLLLKTTPDDAIRLPYVNSRRVIVSGTMALEALALALLAPGLSQDVLRYRMDGRIWLMGQSPYVTTPLQLGLSPYGIKGSDDLDMEMPFAELHTIYPPAAQAIFIAARAAENRLWSGYGDTSWADWHVLIGRLPWHARAVPQRLTAAACAVGCVWVLLSILRSSNLSPWYAVLLGWNPLFVIETGGMGHVDVVGVLFVLLTIRALQSNRPILATATLALAAGVKPHVVLLAPFLLCDALAAGSRVQLKWLAVAFIAFLALVYSPMLYQQGYKGWIKTSHVYATSWEANGSIYDLIKASADETDGVAVQRAKDRARALAGAAVVVTMLIAWFARADLATAGYWIFLVALLFSPVVYPWYLLWVLCFVPLLRGWQGMTALVWAATVGVSYLLWRTSDWVLPARWLLVEYVPVYATLALELAWLVSSRGRGAPAGRPLAVSQTGAPMNCETASGGAAGSTQSTGLTMG